MFEYCRRRATKTKNHYHLVQRSRRTVCGTDLLALPGGMWCLTPDGWFESPQDSRLICCVARSDLIGVASCRPDKCCGPCNRSAQNSVAAGHANIEVVTS